jgi:prepilin-type processing-associated H-X9-DG protein
MLKMYANESRGQQFPPMKLFNCAGELQPWNAIFAPEAVYPEYLSDLDVLICPSNAYAGSALECFDEGHTASPLWEAHAPFTGNGIVEHCEINVEPYYYYGFALTSGLFRGPDDVENFELAIAGWAGELDEAFDSGGPAAAAAFANGDWKLEYEGTPVPVQQGAAATIYRLREGIERFLITDINNPAASSRAQSEVAIMHDAVSEEPEHFNHIPGGANVLYLDGHVAFIRWVPGHEHANPFPVNHAGFVLHEAGEGGHHHGP